MLRLTLFGGFTLLGADGTTLVVASRKGRALLAYLAMQRRPTGREQLAALFWGDGGEARARGSLRQALTTLRQEVPGDEAWLEATADHVAVNHQRLWVDVVAADDRLREGDVEGALELCARGELLANVNPGSLEFDEWRDGERRRWRERETSALLALAERTRQAGAHAQLLTLGRRLLRIEPWNEEAHRFVMEALAALGRRSEALRQYQLASEALRAELGVAPAAATERLLMKIRSERTKPAPEPTPAAAPDAPDAPDDRPVGRTLERLQIQGLFQGCRAAGRGHVILVRGEAGMGKSTFLRQALEVARAQGFQCRVVEATDAGAGRNLEVLRGVLGALDAETLAPPEHRLAVDELLGKALGADEAALAAALEPEARAEAHLRAVEALVASVREPLLIAVEDLHWCDLETVRVLCAMAGAAPQHRTVVVFTCRSGEEPATLAWSALLRRGSVTSIDLGPLGPEEAGLLAARYGAEDPELMRRCLERAGGHPLFLLQLLESGAAGEVVPDSVQAAVLARLARVSPAERQVLERAAIVGEPFSLARMEQLLEQDAAVPVATVIDRLVQQGWLRLHGPHLAIGHDLVAGAILAGLDAGTRTRLHRWAAACFAGSDPLRSAEHLERAGDAGAALAYLSVAREALGERRLDLAESVLARIDALAAEPKIAFSALCLRGDVRRERGDAAGSHDVFSRAARLAQTPDEHVRARLGQASALRLLDRRPEALSCLEQAEALLAPDEHATRAPLEYLRGNLLFTSGDVTGCRQAHERALAHARQAESPADEVAALSGLGDAYFLEGRLISAARVFEDCRELARVHGVLRMEAAACLMLALTELYDNRPGPGMELALRSLTLARQIGDVRLLCLATTVASTLHRERGEWAQARAVAGEGQAAARRLGNERLEGMSVGEMARTALAEGAYPEAQRLARQALSMHQRSDGMPVSGPSLFATLAVAETDVEAARAGIRQGEALLAAGCPSHSHLGLREAGMAVAARRGDWEEMRRHARALAAHFGPELPPRAAFVIELAQRLEAGQDTADLRERARAAGVASLTTWPSTFTAP